MNPRLIFCFGLSVLLHGLLLLALVLILRVESKGYVHGRNAASSQLNIFIEAASNNKKLAVPEPKQKKETAVSIPAQVKPVAEPFPPTAANAPQQSPASELFRPPSPGVRQQMQMDYRQMQEAQARQYAHQQAQFVIGSLQADIEQRLNLHRKHVEGKCTWLENATGNAARLQCESKALESQIQDVSERLTALRQALRTQGAILDGFTVGTNAGRAAIKYHEHPANAIPAP